MAGEERLDEGIGIELAYTKCGWGIGRFKKYVGGYVGWAGAAGAVLQWNTKEQIGFAYVPTQANGRVHKPRAIRLMLAINRAIDKIKCKLEGLDYMEC